MEDRASETEFRKVLTGMESGVTCVVLSQGVDAEGVVHDSEVIIFRRLGDAQLESVSVHPLLYHFRRWVRSNHTPLQLSSASSPPPSELTNSLPSSPSSLSQPSWLTEAEVHVEIEAVDVEEGTEDNTSHESLTSSQIVSQETALHNIPVLLSDIPEHFAIPSPPKVALHTTQFKLDGIVVLTLEGVVTPAMFTSLAQSNSIIYLPTIDGIRTSLTRVRNAMWLGMYIVDPTSWIPEERMYNITIRTGRTQIASQRTVGQMHRMKRRQFERR
tara:strand:- start:3431 stop:4246 length:816 start_codon:yes stop_codon:yes gene_type:complete